MTASSRASAVASVKLRQILDSRGRPTVEADILLNDGSPGRASVPSGASTGKYEAQELRDGDPQHYEGQGVRNVAAVACAQLLPHLLGAEALDQAQIDATLREIDGTPNLQRLGCNPILAISLATARAAAAHTRQPLHRYLNSLVPGIEPALPLPMTNILSGGAHAHRGMDFQDFLVVPHAARSYSQALEWIARVRAAAATFATREGFATLLADEGGLSPGYRQAEQALMLMVWAIEAAGLRVGEDLSIAVDVAASQLFCAEAGTYRMHRMNCDLEPQQMLTYVSKLCRSYPIRSIEDPFDQDDWEPWRQFTDAFRASRLQVVGDDLFATNAERVARGCREKVATAVLIKLNQNGTLSGTLEVMARARASGYATVVSARSGETEDSFIADLAVATGAGQIKIGSVRNSERQSKYNQLLRIEEDDELPFSSPFVSGISNVIGV